MVVVVVMLVSVGATAGVATICSGRQAGRVKQCVTSAARAVVWLALLYVCSMHWFVVTGATGQLRAGPGTPNDRRAVETLTTFARLRLWRRQQRQC